MKKAAVWAVCAALALATLFVCMDSAAQLRHAAPVFAREDRVTVVIDAGHGGEDGGPAFWRVRSIWRLQRESRTCCILRACGRR